MVGKRKTNGKRVFSKAGLPVNLNLSSMSADLIHLNFLTENQHSCQTKKHKPRAKRHL